MHYTRCGLESLLCAENACLITCEHCKHWASAKLKLLLKSVFFTFAALPRKRKRNSCEIDANENEESCTPALVVAMNKGTKLNIYLCGNDMSFLC